MFNATLRDLECVSIFALTFFRYGGATRDVELNVGAVRIWIGRRGEEDRAAAAARSRAPRVRKRGSPPPTLLSIPRCIALQMGSKDDSRCTPPLYNDKRQLLLVPFLRRANSKKAFFVVEADTEVALGGFHI